MADIRTFIVHKQSEGKRFTQIDFFTLGKAMGVLDKIGGKNLYLYLASNADNFKFEFKVANFANWLGDPMYTEEGKKIESSSAKYRKQVNTGIEDMIKAGYLVEKYPNVYDFFVDGSGKNCDDCDKLSSLEQSVTEVTICSEKNKNDFLEQSVTKGKICYEGENLLRSL